MAVKKLCVFCKHFEMDFGSRNWSEVTPGDDATPPECSKGYFMDENGYDLYFGYPDLDQFRDLIQKAKKCKEYKFFKETD